MKPAVFQIDQLDGFVRLVCIPVPTLRSAVELEAALRERLAPCLHVTLLGRFDRIEMVTTVAEFLDCALDAGELILKPPTIRDDQWRHG